MNTGNTKPRATHAGTLFGGLLDCYVLEDERRVVSQRGVVRTLTDGGREGGNLGAYLARLPNSSALLAAGAEVEFTLPGGGTAKGREATWLVDLLRAYDEASDLGQLHHAQQHLARNARKILRALAGVGIVSLVDNATGYEVERRREDLPFLLQALLMSNPLEWDLMWPPEFTASIVRLHGGDYAGGPQPRWLASTYGRLYTLILGREVMAELRRLNPEPEFGTNHHQWLTPPARDRLRREIPIVTALAEQCATKSEFWARMRHRYSKRPLQLVLGGPR